MDALIRNPVQNAIVTRRRNSNEKKPPAGCAPRGDEINAYAYRSGAKCVQAHTLFCLFTVKTNPETEVSSGDSKNFEFNKSLCYALRYLCHINYQRIINGGILENSHLRRI